MATVKKKLGKHKLPSYATMMADYHRAFAPELKAMIDTLPIDRGERVLDFACGDGCYAQWLARRVGPAGQVLALDISPAFLDLAQPDGPPFGAGTEGFSFFRRTSSTCRWRPIASTWSGVPRACTVCLIRPTH